MGDFCFDVTLSYRRLESPRRVADWSHGRVCTSKPVRADYLDQVVWEHITALLADPALIRTEINRRRDQTRTADPVTRQRARLETALAKASKAVTRMIEAFQEH